MSSLSDLRTEFRALIGQLDETTSTYTNSECNSLLNQAQKFLATFIEYPIAHSSATTLVAGTATYSLPADNILIKEAYIGNPAVQGDIKHLKILYESELAQMRPGWLETAVAARGEPDTLMIYENGTCLLSPTSSSSYADGSRALYLTYVNYPTDLSGDSSTPTLPAGYHSLLPIYAAHLAYFGKLNNPTFGGTLKKDFFDKVKALQQTLTQKKGQIFWTFGSDDDMNDTGVGTIIP